jgi:major inositol transporter-like SP family MFS transporter
VLQERSELEPRTGEEAGQQPGAVLHPSQPRLHQRRQLGIAMIVLTVVGMWILGLMGRRKMMLLGFSGVAASHLGLLVSYLLPESTLRSYLILLFMLLVTAFMVTFLGTTGFLVLSELFPLPIRGFAMGASLGGLWVANSTISFLFPILAESYGSLAVFSGFMVLNVLAALFALRYIPETKGRTLEELEVELRNRYSGVVPAGR